MANEIVTEAVVLGSDSQVNGDRRIHLFTRELGRVTAKAKAGMKMTSKLSPHLDLLNLSEVRLKNHNSYLITDALTKNRFENLRKQPELMERALEIFSLINLITPFNLKDPELWYHLAESMKKSKFDGRELLKILGYDPRLATCSLCEEKKTLYFIPLEQSFVCGKCSAKIDDSKLFKI